MARPTTDATANRTPDDILPPYNATRRARRRPRRSFSEYNRRVRPMLAPDGSNYLRTHRVVTVAERVWVVREEDASLSPGAPSGHCLVCESALSVRCAWDYPREWAHLSDEELLQLFS